jgi:hypothetical protein
MDTFSGNVQPFILLQNRTGREIVAEKPVKSREKKTSERQKRKMKTNTMNAKSSKTHTNSELYGKHSTSCQNSI